MSQFVSHFHCVAWYNPVKILLVFNSFFLQMKQTVCEVNPTRNYQTYIIHCEGYGFTDPINIQHSDPPRKRYLAIYFGFSSEFFTIQIFIKWLGDEVTFDINSGRFLPATTSTDLFVIIVLNCVISIAIKNQFIAENRPGTDYSGRVELNFQEWNQRKEGLKNQKVRERERERERNGEIEK